MRRRYLKKLHMELRKGEFENPVKKQVCTPKQVFDVFRALKDKAQETAVVLYLWDDLRPSLYSVLSVGNATGTSVRPRDIYGQGYVMRAHSFILIHNHPQGDPTPSPEDRELMDALLDQSQAMDIRFLDCIIVGEDSYWSMFEEKLGGSTDYTLGSV